LESPQKLELGLARLGISRLVRGYATIIGQQQCDCVTAQDRLPANRPLANSHHFICPSYNDCGRWPTLQSQNSNILESAARHIDRLSEITGEIGSSLCLRPTAVLRYCRLIGGYTTQSRRVDSDTDRHREDPCSELGINLIDTKLGKRGPP
jgi:hypothetical protein